MARVATSKTLRGYLQGISGLFISPSNPGGLTPKELDVLTALVFVLSEYHSKQVTAESKERVADMMNYPIQVITNYIKKLRDKKVLTLNNELHPLLIEREITIKFSSSQEDKNNV